MAWPLGITLHGQMSQVVEEVSAEIAGFVTSVLGLAQIQPTSPLSGGQALRKQLSPAHS